MHILQTFLNVIFVHCATVDKVSTDSMSHGPSAIAEFLVITDWEG